jgi:hypothetical protein
MLVYRVESKSRVSDQFPNLGRGYYRTDNEIIYDVNMIDKSRHPTPERDSKLSDVWEDLRKLGEHPSWAFGFKSMEALRSWFYDKEMTEGKEEELVIGVYSIQEDEVHHGFTQSIFVGLSATHLYDLHSDSDEDIRENRTYR